MRKDVFIPILSTAKLCNNAFSHASPKDFGLLSAIPHGLSFDPQALFFGLEAIVAHLAPTSDITQPLRKMLAELEQHHIHGYYRLKAYVRYHSDIVRKVRKVQKDKGLDRHERYSAGMRLLLDGITFRDLAKAYFEIVEEVEQSKEQRTRKDTVVETEKTVIDAAEKRGRFWKEHPDGFSMIKKGKKGNFLNGKWIQDDRLVKYAIVKEN
ncbi:hypothetical protein E8E12_002597 [Didymella heteroderae]|uniref:Uncharacterized protein n=1 Tax=Didymella heteroderae TaxID=1769908 RepID=A0A9P4WN17_9PLEO|nr:hypothetical protein E8E12_002597 [Didymella heteroderae]